MIFFLLFIKTQNYKILAETYLNVKMFIQVIFFIVIFFCL